jgi:hypothetical protein
MILVNKVIKENNRCALVVKIYRYNVNFPAVLRKIRNQKAYGTNAMKTNII